MPDPLLRFRPEFPILERCTYLVSNSLGAMPRSVPERLQAYDDAWRSEGVRAWAKGWWEMPVTVGDGIEHHFTTIQCSRHNGLTPPRVGAGSLSAGPRARDLRAPMRWFLRANMMGHTRRVHHTSVVSKVMMPLRERVAWDTTR